MLSTKILSASPWKTTILRRMARTSTTPSQFRRQFHASAVAFDDLPYHIVVGMPALSPTMESGNLAEWYLEEGAEFGAGDSLAKIETDKASIDFEAQDDGVIAKILLEAGAEDVAVGTPIMVTVEEPEDVAAFANYSLPDEAQPAAPADDAPAAAEVEDTPAVAAAPPPPPPVAEPVTPAAPPPVVAAAEEVPASTPDMAAVIQKVAPVLSTSWGQFAKINSPIAKTLAKNQQAYLDKYGTTGQVPL